MAKVCLLYTKPLFFLKCILGLADFDGDVLAWSFDPKAEVIGCPDFEVDVLGLETTIPALVGQSSSVAEIVDGKHCILHPVVTCLAERGMFFSRPLLLRFPVGDLESMESDSDSENDDEPEETYRLYLKEQFSPMRREEGSSKWVPIEGDIVMMESGVFVVEVKVSHFTEYTLKRNVEATVGQAEVTEIKRLPNHTSMRNVFLFVNQGNILITVYYWHCPSKRDFLSRVQASLTVGSVAAVSGEADRERLDPPAEKVWSRHVPPILPSSAAGASPAGKSVISNPVPSSTKSINVAWTTLEEQEDAVDDRIVTVWGLEYLDHKNAMIFGPLPEKKYARVKGLRVKSGEDMGVKVRDSLSG